MFGIRLGYLNIAVMSNEGKRVSVPCPFPDIATHRQGQLNALYRPLSHRDATTRAYTVTRRNDIPASDSELPDNRDTAAVTGCHEPLRTWTRAP